MQVEQKGFEIDDINQIHPDLLMIEPESDKTQIVQGSLMDYLYLGAKHMITGYDHILFLIGVIFFLIRFSDIVKFVTAFTIGHSITLIFATLF